MKSAPLLLLLSLLIFGCKAGKDAKSSMGDGQIDLIILQLNDTYEIAGVERGTVGGMARIATLRKQLEAENPNTLFVHAGDFLYPSLIGTMKYEGESIKGRQMVECMNACEVDVVAFGNHEFDLKEAELQKRLNESAFDWIGTNVLHKMADGTKSFHKKKEGQEEHCPAYWYWTPKDQDGTQVNIGFFSACINSNPKDYVVYQDHTERVQQSMKQLRKDSDIILGLTHLEINQDTVLARQFQEVPLIMGGHDHDNMLYEIGKTRVTKADANARTVYVHRLHYDKRSKQLDIRSTLVKIDQFIMEDPAVKQIVEKWTGIADESFRKEGFDPYKVVARVDTPLDGRESSIRNQPTNLGEMVARAMGAAAKQPVDAAIVNGGSFRVDDQLLGEITEYDIIRTMPYGGKILEVDLKGSLLKAVLDEGWANKGKGGFLQWDKVRRNYREKWEVNGELIDEGKNYHIALNDYLLLGLDIKILTRANPGIIKITEPQANQPTDLRNDIRQAVIKYLAG
ncbi:MAG: bifunctional metallophosphatase/5'-nucleotidase [Bacteroidota bacterium]